MIVTVFITIVIILLAVLAVWGISLLTAIAALPRQICMALVVLAAVWLIGTQWDLW